MFDIFCMAMGGDSSLALPSHTQFTRYNGTHLDTIRRLVNRSSTEYMWVVSDLCDYSDFDFTWQPKPWEADQIHCWASGNQQFGDTFLVPVAAFKRQQARLKLLEWYKHINWHSEPYIPRFKWPTINNLDELTTLYAWIKKTPANIDYEPCLWKKRDLHVFTQSGSVALVPRDCKTHFKEQLYDYPYILRHTGYNIEEKPQDVVFISYDEKNAERNWDILAFKCPRAKKLHGIEGMENALYQAALLSNTDWFYAVFAKTRLHEDFDFSYNPDRLEGDKHYIFNCRNMVNGLEYGHMGIILYNKQMVIDSHDYEKLGLDYTLSHRNDVVPILSCYGVFNTSPYETWRSAFRECIKLAQMMDTQPTIETNYRLNTWLDTAHGDYAKYCLNGAQDGVDFYNQHKDDMTELKKTFRWNWLQDYFDSKYAA